MRQTILEERSLNRQGLIDSKQSKIEENLLIKKEVKQLNQYYKMKGKEKQLEVKNQLRHRKNIIELAHRNCDYQKLNLLTERKKFKNNECISEWLSNSSSANKLIGHVQVNQAKEERILMNIFKTQDIIDKYKVIYDSLKQTDRILPLDLDSRRARLSNSVNKKSLNQHGKLYHSGYKSKDSL